MDNRKKGNLLMAETLGNPVLWGQTYLVNRDGSPREYWPHQVEDLLCQDRTIVHLDPARKERRPDGQFGYQQKRDAFMTCLTCW